MYLVKYVYIGRNMDTKAIFYSPAGNPKVTYFKRCVDLKKNALL